MDNGSSAKQNYGLSSFLCTFLELEPLQYCAQQHLRIITNQGQLGDSYSFTFQGHVLWLFCS